MNPLHHPVTMAKNHSFLPIGVEGKTKKLFFCRKFAWTTYSSCIVIFLPVKTIWSLQRNCWHNNCLSDGLDSNLLLSKGIIADIYWFSTLLAFDSKTVWQTSKRTNMALIVIFISTLNILVVLYNLFSNNETWRPS